MTVIFITGRYKKTLDKINHSITLTNIIFCKCLICLKMNSTYLGNLFIVAAPSGGGKTSLVKRLVAEIPNLEVSVSHTTRAPRPGEKQAVDYYFIDKAQFQTMIANQDFIEYAQVFDSFYGTSVAEINQRLAQGIDVFLDIDWQGSQQIKNIFAEAISIFIIPPSLAALRERLQQRAQDNCDVIARRMQRAQQELSHYSEFDYLVVNDSFEQALSELNSIILANRLKQSRQARKISKLLSLLLA